MNPKRRSVGLLRPMRRDAAEHYLFMALLSFAASVSLTRLSLALTGYPQLGTGELHIAHVLWGGLLLFAAALLPLIIAERWVYTAAALLAGVGVGLFIDEVGKFITQRNNYFYPAAAPIVYTFFLLTILLFLNIRRFTDLPPHAELYRALGLIGEMLVHPLGAQERALLESQLDQLARNSTSESHADLARALLKFMRRDALSAAPVQRGSWHWAGWRATRAVASLVSGERLRWLLIVGISAIGLLTLKNPVQVLLAGWLPPGVNIFLQAFYTGRHIAPAAAPFWFSARLTLEWIVGALLLASAGLLLFKRLKQGATMGYVALLLSLTTVNLLLFYFEQFSTIITTSIQFMLLLGLLRYQRGLSKR
jgi:hypothetical protein